MKNVVRAPHQPAQGDCTVNIHPNGTITDRGHLDLSKTLKFPKRPSRKAKGRRSPITGFSKQSASRLRYELATTCGPEGWVCFGLTITVPGPIIDGPQWRRLWRAFLARARRLGGVAFIWRIEKQERGQPHIHCVCWAERRVKAERLKEIWLENLALLGPYRGDEATIDFEGATVRDGVTQAEFKPGWISVRSREFWPGAAEHAVQIDSLDEKDDMSWWRYLASHASKSKQAQLGWLGRQWAVFNKHLLAHSKPMVLELPRQAMNKVIRHLKRITNCHHASGHGKQTWFGRPETVKRLCEWACGNCRPVRKLGCMVFSPFRKSKKEWKMIRARKGR